MMSVECEVYLWCRVSVSGVESVVECVFVGWEGEECSVSEACLWCRVSSSEVCQ